MFLIFEHYKAIKVLTVLVPLELSQTPMMPLMKRLWLHQLLNIVLLGYRREEDSEEGMSPFIEIEFHSLILFVLLILYIVHSFAVCITVQDGEINCTYVLINGSYYTNTVVVS